MSEEGIWITADNRNIEQYDLGRLIGKTNEELQKMTTESYHEGNVLQVWLERPRQADGEGKTRNVPMVRSLPAAALPVGTVVIIEGRDFTFEIAKIENSTPRPGQITWTDKEGLEEVVGGNEKIRVVSLP